MLRLEVGALRTSLLQQRSNNGSKVKASDQHQGQLHDLLMCFLSVFIFSEFIATTYIFRDFSPYRPDIKAITNDLDQGTSNMEDPIERNFGIINNFFMSLECPSVKDMEDGNNVRNDDHHTDFCFKEY